MKGWWGESPSALDGRLSRRVARFWEDAIAHTGKERRRRTGRTCRKKHRGRSDTFHSSWVELQKTLAALARVKVSRTRVTTWLVLGYFAQNRVTLKSNKTRNFKVTRGKQRVTLSRPCSPARALFYWILREENAKISRSSILARFVALIKGKNSYDHRLKRSSPDAIRSGDTH